MSMLHEERARLVLPSDQDASGRSLGPDELQHLLDVITSGTLTSTKGVHTPAMQAEFGALLGGIDAIACSSGSAAVHAAVAALDPEPGDEFITTSITDMGALTPILYQGAIPHFADVDPITGNVTAETVRERLSDRTRAVIVTHLFGNPCDMTAIRAIADAAGVPVIEDAAQAFLAHHAAQPVGTWGAIGCFSFQQGKHLTAGEGGIVTTSDPALARRMRLFVNKAWPYGEANPDHEFVAPNYRITELQSAVLRAQLPKLADWVAHRGRLAARLTAAIADVPGIGAPVTAEGDVHAYWRYCLRVDPAVVPGGPDAIAARLRDVGVPAAPRYIQKPAFRCRVIAEQQTFGSSRWPFSLARPEAVDYATDAYPGTFRMLSEALVLPWNERMTDEHVDRLAEAIADAVEATIAGADLR